MAEEVTEVQVETPEVVAEKPVRSGLNRELSFIAKPAEPTNKKVDDKTPPSFDYSFIKDLSEDDKKKYEPLKTKYGEEIYHQTVTLANDVKKHQRLVSEREKELSTFKSQKPDEELAKHREFIDGLRKDAIGTYRRFQKDFDLPEPEFLERQVVSGGDVQTRLEQWQTNELVPKIEKKFKIEGGTFVYDPSEAYKAGTPSYEYRVTTEKQERELTTEFETTVNRQQEVIGTVKSQLDGDMKYLRETFFPASEYETKDDKGNVINAEEAQKKADEAFVGFLAKLDENQNAIKAGKFEAEQNPYSLRTIFRGTHFEELAKARADKAVQAVHKQYNEKGLYLPTAEMPADVTNNKGTAPQMQDAEKRRKFSPALREINRQN